MAQGIDLQQLSQLLVEQQSQFVQEVLGQQNRTQVTLMHKLTWVRCLRREPLLQWEAR